MSVYNIKQLIQEKKITTRLELVCLAIEQERMGNTSVVEFIANKGTKAVDEALAIAEVAVHIMKKESCPAWGKLCTSSGGKNHFPPSRKCKGRNVHGVVANIPLTQTVTLELSVL